MRKIILIGGFTFLALVLASCSADSIENTATQTTNLAVPTSINGQESSKLDSLTLQNPTSRNINNNMMMSGGTDGGNDYPKR